MSAATRKECNECARREYVVKLTKQLAADLMDVVNDDIKDGVVYNDEFSAIKEETHDEQS